MTEQILSPGVYSYENDQSYVPPGQSATGLAVVGPTEKGEAFVPTDVTSYADFVAKFGAGSDTYVPQTVFSYLQAGTTAKVTRVLGNGGWRFSSSSPITAIISTPISGALSGSATILAVLHPSKNENASSAAVSASISHPTLGQGSGSLATFYLNITGSAITKGGVSSSLVIASSSFISKVLGTDEGFQSSSAFPYLLFSNFANSSSNFGLYPTASLVFVSTSATSCTFTSSYAGGYDAAKTPWILSEGGVRLFRLIHKSHGTKTNKDVKIQISNISVPSDTTQYTTFDVVVRSWNDTDRNPSVLEQYIGVSLDPDSPNYIAAYIGDKYSEYNATLGKVVDLGDFTSLSNYIRVELSDGVKNASLPPSVKPNGFEALYETIAGFSNVKLPAAVYNYNTASVAGVYSGFDYSNSDNFNYLNPIPSEAGVGNNINFAVSGSNTSFIVPMQGGLDGMNIATIKKIGSAIKSDGTNVFGFDLSSATTGGAQAYQKAFNILQNNEAYSFDLLSVPGVLEQYHSSVTALAQNLCEERTDAVYIRDLTGVDATVAQAAAKSAGLDSSYSATYYPWVRVKDLTSNKDIYVPPSVIVPQAFAYNDRIGAEWYAPAGLNRGVVGGAIDTRNRLSKDERDTLYQARINPITKFPNTGVVIYGQKTLQVRSTALDRVNVRRLLIALRRYISDVAKGLVFEQNTIQTRNKFLALVNPYLESVQNRQGLYAFRVVMDETNNTADVIDRNQLVGKVYLQPTKTAEFIILEYNIQPTGVTFA